MVLLDTGTPGTSREIYSEDADDGTRTRNPSDICWLNYTLFRSEIEKMNFSDFSQRCRKLKNHCNLRTRLSIELKFCALPYILGAFECTKFGGNL